MPAYRPTADCIWNSFLSSGKRHLILTGSRGAGKTFLIRQLCADMSGIKTLAVPQTAVYMEESPKGAKAQIGIYDPTLPGPKNKMRPCPDGFEAHAIPMLQRLIQSPGEWAFVDEIGYLESKSIPYQAALAQLFDRKRVIAAVRRQDAPFLLEMRNRPDAFCVDLDAPFGNTGCVIMASGLSKRFGANKLLADFHGVPMISRILSATQDIFPRRVVVTRQPAVAELCTEKGIEVILHSLPHRSDTVRIGLEAVGDIDGCMFCMADQPLIKQDTIASLALSADHDRSSIWRPAHGENQGSPVLFPRWAFELLRNLPQGAGGGSVIRAYPHRVRTLPVRDPYELMDVDDQETLKLLLRVYSQTQSV